jgi:uncharacterized protein YjiS (DUF1127 family)
MSYGFTESSFSAAVKTGRGRFMEMIMSAISSAPAAARDTALHSWAGAPAADALKRWWVAYLTWRIERAATIRLWSLSDLELKDMGLTRSNITGAVRGENRADGEGR